MHISGGHHIIRVHITKQKQLTSYDVDANDDDDGCLLQKDGNFNGAAGVSTEQILMCKHECTSTGRYCVKVHCSELSALAPCIRLPQTSLLANPDPRNCGLTPSSLATSKPIEASYT